MNSLVPVTLAPGMYLYKYQLLRKIGQGGFGEVWIATDHTLQRQFALKILKPRVSVDERLREAQIGNLLSHNNLVRVHHADVVNVSGADVVILVMDYHPAGSVETLANPAGYLPLPEVLRIARDILQGLDYLHARGFFHNDTKPGNVLIGPQRQAMLADYGITGISADRRPVPAPSAYLLHRAPEVEATGHVGVGSDLFQVGMTLVRLLLGLNHLREIRLRIGPDDYESRLHAGLLVRSQDFPDHVPAPVRRVVLTAVDPDPQKRYASSLEMRRAVERLSFPGYWSVDASGREFGQDRSYQYTYTLMPFAGGKFDLLCQKQGLSSGRAQRVTKFCRSGVTKALADQALTQFKKFVVLGR